MKTTLLGLFLMIALAGCSKPEVPVTVTFRTSPFSNGLVAQFHNNSNRHLAVVLDFQNKTLHQEKNGYIEIEPSATKEIGWLEGWKFMSGETITISHEDYSTVTLRVP